MDTPQIPEECIICQKAIEDQGHMTCVKCEEPCDVIPMNQNDLSGNMLSMNVKSKCCIADVEMGGIKSTCSEECHGKLVEKIIAESGEFIEETDIHGNIRMIPTRFLLENGGLTEEDIMQFPIKGKENDKNPTRCECLACKEGIQAVKDKQEKFLKEFGFYVHKIPLEDVEMEIEGEKIELTRFNVHTHGVLENMSHPDLQTFACGVNPDLCHRLLSDMVKQIKEGRKFEPGQKYKDVIGNDMEIKTELATEGGRNVVRVIFPNQDGTFSGEFYNVQISDLTPSLN